MAYTVNIVGAKLLLEGGLVDGGIHISFGKIKKIGKATNLPRADEKIDAGGLIALPGLIDAHVHLRDMNLSYKEDFYTGTCASAAGGFTTVLDMPNTDPPTNSAERLKRKIEEAKNKVLVNVGFHALPPGDPSEMAEMVKLGARSFKIYPGAFEELKERGALTKVFERCASLKALLTIHGEDGGKIEEIKERLMKQGRSNFSGFLEAHSPEVEYSGIRKALSSALKGNAIHFCHVTTAESVNEILRAKTRGGLRLSTEATPHHLFLSEEELKKLGGKALTLPPLRAKALAEGLWREVVKGRVDIIASDHAPHALEEKRGNNAWEISPGIPGLETTLPLLLTKVNLGEITLREVVELLARRPSKIFNLRFKGELREGFDGDVTLISLKERHEIDSGKFYSKAKYSPFDGFKCVGKAVKAIVSGKLVMEDGEITGGKGDGSIIGGP